MRDLAEKWAPVPDWKKVSIQFDGTTIGTVAGLSQLLVSGDISAWSRASGIASAPAGASPVITGDRYAVRLARDRILAVSAGPFDIASGWHEDGFAVSSVNTGLHIFEIDGPRMLEVLAHAMMLDPKGSTASAAMLFAGLNAFVYRYSSAGCVRVHVDSGLAPHLWQWLEQVFHKCIA